jgi:chitinase
MHGLKSGRRAAAASILLAAGMLAGCGTEAPQAPDWDFAKVDASGAELADGTLAAHACVLDRRTGLVWEVKHSAPGLHYRDDLFSWYSSDEADHLTEPGLMGGGTCGLERCDTEAFVLAVNGAGLCGRYDWRLPSRDEAMTLLDPARVGNGPAIDPEYFPGTAEGEYWTATTFRMYPQGAWAVDTIYGQDRVDWKTSSKRARLVSGSKTAVRPKRRGR